jgi:hypothetical protein
MIPNTTTTPTIMKLLYYFSHLCTLNINPHPELDSEGNQVHLKNAPRTADKAPKIPNPIRPERITPLPTVIFPTTPRRSPRFQTQNTSSQFSAVDSLHLENLTSLGCKGWRATLNTGLTVFTKLWDGWKFSPEYSEHEASVYYHLQDLWGSIIPTFLGIGDWGFYHILLLSFIEVFVF